MKLKKQIIRDFKNEEKIERDKERRAIYLRSRGNKFDRNENKRKEITSIRIETMLPKTEALLKIFLSETERLIIGTAKDYLLKGIRPNRKISEVVNNLYNIKKLGGYLE
jgi:hypothetical protein